MKDQFKNDLNVGDLVVYLGNKRGRIGVVLVFTAKEYVVVKMLFSMRTGNNRLRNSKVSNYHLIRYHKELLDPEYLTFYNQIVNDINTHTS